MVRLILITWIKLSQAFSWSDAGKEAFYIQNYLLEFTGDHWSNIVESFNSDVIMVVNGQRITAFVNDCLCGIKAISQYVFKFCS